MSTTALQCVSMPDSYAVIDTDIEVVESIFDEEISLVVLRRPVQSAIVQYLPNVTVRRGRQENRSRVTVRKPEVGAVFHGFPQGPGRDVLTEDYLWLLELFATVADAETIGVRVAATLEQTCPRFHTDQVTLRMICTWQGPATEWLEHLSTDRRFLGSGSRGKFDEVSGLMLPGARIQTMRPFDVGFMKGEAWPGNAGRGLVHRSPKPESLPRVMMTLDALF